MKTKKILSIIVLSLLVLSLPSCKDYLTEKAPGTTSLSDFYTSSTAAIESTNGCYAPLAWDYNNTYCSEWFIGDIVSDDALKGGQNISDMKDAYDGKLAYNRPKYLAFGFLQCPISRYCSL